MTVILNKIFESHFDEINTEKQNTPQNECAELFIRDKIVHHGTGDHGIKQIADSKNERTKKVHCKELSVRFVITDKSL
jgi:hypothetical protein